MVNGICFTMDIVMDKVGRMVLPKEIRDRLHLVGGDFLEAEVRANEILLRPRRASVARISREGTRAVWDAPGASATVEEIAVAMGRGRAERDARAGGL